MSLHTEPEWNAELCHGHAFEVEGSPGRSRDVLDKHAQTRQIGGQAAVVGGCFHSVPGQITSMSTPRPHAGPGLITSRFERGLHVGAPLAAKGKTGPLPPESVLHGGPLATRQQASFNHDITHIFCTIKRAQLDLIYQGLAREPPRSSGAQQAQPRAPELLGECCLCYAGTDWLPGFAARIHGLLIAPFGLIGPHPTHIPAMPSLMAAAAAAAAHLSFSFDFLPPLPWMISIAVV